MYYRMLRGKIISSAILKNKSNRGYNVPQHHLILVLCESAHNQGQLLLFRGRKKCRVALQPFRTAFTADDSM